MMAFQTRRIAIGVQPLQSSFQVTELSRTKLGLLSGPEPRTFPSVNFPAKLFRRLDVEFENLCLPVLDLHLRI